MLLKFGPSESRAQLAANQLLKLLSRRITRITPGQELEVTEQGEIPMPLVFQTILLSSQDVFTALEEVSIASAFIGIQHCHSAAVDTKSI